MKSKLLTIISLVLVTLTILVGCGNNNNQSSKKSSNATSATPDSTLITDEIQEGPSPKFITIEKEVLCPKMKYTDIDNSSLAWATDSRTEIYPTYVVTLRLLCAINKGETPSFKIPSLESTEYFMILNDYSYPSPDFDWSTLPPEVQKGDMQIEDIVLVIEYMPEVDDEIWLESFTGEKLFNLSGISYDRQIIENGEVPLYGCGMVKEDNGMQHYLIPIPVSSEPQKTGFRDEDQNKGTFKFNLICLNDKRNLKSTQINNVNETWSPKSLKVEYDDLKYLGYINDKSAAKNKNSNCTYLKNENAKSFSNTSVTNTEVSIGVIYDNPDDFKVPSNLTFEIDALKFKFDIAAW